METIEIDCRNLEGSDSLTRVMAVLKSQKNNTIRVLVNTESAIDSISRFLGVQNFQVSVDSMVDGSIVEGSRIPLSEDSFENAIPGGNLSTTKPTQPQTMVFISSDYIGKEDDLGKDLMINFIENLSKMKQLPWNIALVHCGVKLAAFPSKALPPLKLLEQSGVNVLVCEKSLKGLGLDKEKFLGKTVSTMEILSSMQESEKVVQL